MMPFFFSQSSLAWKLHLSTQLADGANGPLYGFAVDFEQAAKHDH